MHHRASGQWGGVGRERERRGGEGVTAYLDYLNLLGASFVALGEDFEAVEEKEKTEKEKGPEKIRRGELGSIPLVRGLLYLSLG